MIEAGSGARSLARRAPARLVSIAIAVLGAVGCASQAARTPTPARGDRVDEACAPAFERGLDPHALGFSLAGVTDQVPRALEPLVAFVGDRASGAEVTVEAGDLESSAPFDRAGVAGRGHCSGLAADLVVVRQGRLWALRRTAAAQEAQAQGDALLRDGRGAEARLALATAAAHDRWPLPVAARALADSYTAEGRWDRAVGFYREAAATFAWDDEIFVGLAKALAASGRRPDAIAVWSEAEARRPQMPELTRWLGDDALVRLRPAAAPPAVPLAPGQWRLSGRGAGPFVLAEARAYAGCKEAFRTSARLRQDAVGEDLPTWLWSPGEESVCTALWLRAYVEGRSHGRDVDAGLEELAEIARDGLLDERAIHDVGADEHRWMPALMTDAARARLVAFVAKYRVTRRQRGWLLP